MEISEALDSDLRIGDAMRGARCIRPRIDIAGGP